jgi:hypothetical protein
MRKEKKSKGEERDMVPMTWSKSNPKDIWAIYDSRSNISIVNPYIFKVLKERMKDLPINFVCNLKDCKFKIELKDVNQATFDNI